MIYHRAVRPLFLKHQSRFDSAIADVADKADTLANKAFDKGELPSHSVSHLFQLIFFVWVQFERLRRIPSSRPIKTSCLAFHCNIFLYFPCVHSCSHQYNHN